MRVAEPHRPLGTENERSEPSARELAQVLEQSGEAVIIKDLNAVVTYWNREAALLYGFSAKEAIGQPLRKLHAAELSETDRLRVWTIRLKPGERFGFHRHVLDYFWSVLTSGRARAHMDDGSTVEHTYAAGETRHETHAGGHFKVHDLENIGDTELIFCTVEFLDSANKPLPIPDKVRAK